MLDVRKGARLIGIFKAVFDMRIDDCFYIFYKPARESRYFIQEEIATPLSIETEYDADVWCDAPQL